MKGTVYKNSLEYNFTTLGEEWRQGEEIKGNLKVKNHSQKEIQIDKLQVHLVYGLFKKVHAKDKKSFKIIDSSELTSNISLHSNAEETFPWKFKLASDCPITDQAGSLFLTYGEDHDSFPPNLQLQVSMATLLEDFLQTFEYFFRFKIKQKKFRKDFTQIKLIPPKSKEFGTIDHLICMLKLKDHMIKIKYLFKIKTLKINGPETAIEKKEKEFCQEFQVSKFQAFGGTPNREELKKIISEVVKKATPKLLF